MRIAVVVGGQFGGEGKGKITAHLSRNYNFDIVVRCGGPNSGHGITLDGERIVLRQIPAGVVNPKMILYLAAGNIISTSVLQQEINYFDLDFDRLRIDRNAVIINDECIDDEKRLNLRTKIGSTCSGVGGAISRRILRNGGVKLAKDIPELSPYITNVSEELMSHINANKKIIVEGTQGFGLSLYHSPYYPFTTSRDTTASAFLSEVGISPRLITDIIMTIRTFPIRVGGNSGPIPNEVNWKIIQEESGYPDKITEYTSVTNTVRRVARFDLNILKEAVRINLPTHLALMGVDYLDYKNKNKKDFHDLTNETKEFILLLENELNTKISLIGTGSTDEEIIDLFR